MSKLAEVLSNSYPIGGGLTSMQSYTPSEEDRKQMLEREREYRRQTIATAILDLAERIHVGNSTLGCEWCISQAQEFYGEAKRFLAEFRLEEE